MMFLILLLTVVGLVLYFIRRRLSYWADRNVPHQEPVFPLGNMTGFKPKYNTAFLFQELYNKFKGKGPFAGVYMFINPIVLATDLDFIKNVMVKDFNYFINRGVYHNEKDDPLTGHLFNIEDQKWRNLRTKLSPTFTSGKMKFMYPTIISVAKEFKEALVLAVEKDNVIEMKDFLARFTTDVIGTCAFGLECNSLKDPNAEFRKMGASLFNPPKRIPYKRIITQQFPELSRKMGVKTMPQAFSKWFMDKVEETVDYRLKNNIQRSDFMNLMIQLKGDAENGLTMNEIAAQAFVFFIAGFETSSTAMSFALHEISQNHDIQDKAREEAQRILEKYGGEFTYEAMLEMKYIEQIINESLRKYPPVPNLMRQVRKDYKDPETGIVLEEGTNLFIPVYGLHHDPELYPKPEVFDPDRFTDEEIKSRNPYSFLPFGEGPRNCIGLRFGMMQSKIGLAILLANFKVSTCSKSIIPMKISPTSFILAGVGGLWLKVEKV